MFCLRRLEHHNLDILVELSPTAPRPACSLPVMWVSLRENATVHGPWKAYVSWTLPSEDTEALDEFLAPYRGQVAVGQNPDKVVLKILNKFETLRLADVDSPPASPPGFVLVASLDTLSASAGGH